MSYLLLSSLNIAQVYILMQKPCFGASLHQMEQESDRSKKA